MTVNLIRYSHTEFAVLGHLFKEGEYLCDTLELPWRGNKPLESCIPEGEYPLVYRKSAAFHVKEGYMVESVNGRSDILIHAANSASELKGCIAVGVKSSFLLYNSKDTLSKLISVIGESDFLNIIKADTVWH